MEAKEIKKKCSLQEKPGKMSLSCVEMADCCRRIVNYLEMENKYRIPDYSLWELSRDIKISSKIISKSINGYLGRNFNDLLNRMRIEEVKIIIRRTAAEGRHCDMDEVALRCGFRSRSIFFSRFKMYEGISPGKYLNLYEDKQMVRKEV